MLAALLHVMVIFGGPDWYRFFGAGEHMAQMAEQGLWQPVLVTLFITTVLVIWGLYAFSAAGLIRRLPLLKTALVIISCIYLLRGLAAIPIMVIKPEVVDSFLIWSSLICFVYGMFYALGSWQQWSRL